MTTELLLANTVPQNPADPAYVAQLNALKSALRNGRPVRVSMKYSDGEEYFSELVAGYFRSDRINVVLPLQNYQDNENLVTRLNGLFSECIDTLGTYYWGSYLFGAPNASYTAATAQTIFVPGVEPGYVIKWYSDVATPQLLLRNSPNQNPTDPAYLTQLAALMQAFRDGRRVRVSMVHTSGEYFTQIIGGRLESNRVTAMLPLRPNLTGEALLANTNAIFGGSIDSLGNYYWGAYEFGSDNTAKSINDPAFSANITPNFQNSWWAD
jgi:hypothetical protein